MCFHFHNYHHLLVMHNCMSLRLSGNSHPSSSIHLSVFRLTSPHVAGVRMCCRQTNGPTNNTPIITLNMGDIVLRFSGSPLTVVVDFIRFHVFLLAVFELYTRIQRCTNSTTPSAPYIQFECKSKNKHFSDISICHLTTQRKCHKTLFHRTKKS